MFAVLVSNLLHTWVAHEVGGLVAPVLLGCAVWSSQRRVGSQVDFLHVHMCNQDNTIYQQLLVATSIGAASKGSHRLDMIAAMAGDVNTCAKYAQARTMTCRLPA